MTKIFVAPSKTKKPFLSALEIAFPKVAACALPRPGRKPHNIEENKEIINGFLIEIFSVSRVCGGMLVLLFIEIIKLAEPKRPVRRGSKGSFKFSRFKVIIPRIPVKR